jgi:hypothetical protein
MIHSKSSTNYSEEDVQSSAKQMDEVQDQKGFGLVTKAGGGVARSTSNNCVHGCNGVAVHGGDSGERKPHHAIQRDG